MSGRTPVVAAIVLAAGRSTRMGPQNKLLADVAGKPLVRHAVEAALGSQAEPVLVVTGHMASEVSRALAGLDIAVFDNPDYATGLASSLKTGIRALPRGCDGALVMLGDMPRIEAIHIDRLIAAYSPDAIVVPVRDRKIGNPVLWPVSYFQQLLLSHGDAGARWLMSLHAGQVREVDLGTDAIFADVDTPEALTQARQI